VTFFRWAMRNGAPILFVFALVVFVVAFAVQFAHGWSNFGEASFPGDAGHAPSRLWFVLSAFASSLQSCGTLFAASCIVHILDRRYSAKFAEAAE
jgi:hypothetical protein